MFHKYAVRPVQGNSADVASHCYSVVTALPILAQPLECSGEDWWLAMVNPGDDGVNVHSALHDGWQDTY